MSVMFAVASEHDVLHDADAERREKKAEEPAVMLIVGGREVDRGVIDLFGEDQRRHQVRECVHGASHPLGVRISIHDRGRAIELDRLGGDGAE